MKQMKKFGVGYSVLDRRSAHKRPKTEHQPQETTLPVKIRLRRMGAKKRPFYRLVVANSTDARDGRFIESVRYYDPTTQPPTVKLDMEKVRQWIKNGAQPSDTARSILAKHGVFGTSQPVAAE